MSTFRQPEYLSHADEPRHRIRCPIHGFIRFSENERKIIDHPIFRRLRYIKQLALTDFIYPGASHTRFEHSLGVMELASQAFDQIASRRGDLLESNFSKVAGLGGKALAIGRQLVRMAGLLHDVGHVCFSHAAETVIHKGQGHEAFTFQLVEEPAYLGKELDESYFQGFAALLGKVLRGAPMIPPQLRILKDLVSGEMDADRSDYLLRDSHHCGVEYGRFDHNRMVQCLDLCEAEGGSLEIALHRDGIHSFEALILARYQMNTQVYYHRMRRAFDHYLSKYFEAKGSDLFDNPEKILDQTDIQAMSMILKDAGTDSGEPAKWAKRIRDRRHHRVVLETGEDANAMDIKHSVQVLQELQEKYSGIEFFHDLAKSSIHKLLLPNDTEEGAFVALPIYENTRHIGYLGERSHILRNVPKRFQVARIFADLDRDDPALHEVRQFARECYRKSGGRS